MTTNNLKDRVLGTWVADLSRWDEVVPDAHVAVKIGRAGVMGALSVEFTESELHIRNYSRKSQDFTYAISGTRGDTLVMAVAMQADGRKGVYEATLDGPSGLILRLVEPKQHVMVLKRPDTV